MNKFEFLTTPRFAIFWLAMLAWTAYAQCVSEPLLVPREVYYLAQPPELRSFVKAAIYLVPYLLGVTALVGVALLRSRVLFWLSLGVVTFPFVVDLAYQFAGVRFGFSPEEFQLAKREMAYWPHAIATFGSQILQGLVVLFPFGVVVGFGRRWLAPLRFSAAALLWVPAATLAVGFASHQLGSVDLATYPAPYKMIAAAYEEWGRDTALRTRDPVAVGPVNESMAEKVVWIIDESIRGDVLGINGADVDTTPFLDGYDSMVNLGVANATTNCSHTAHLVLRTGFQDAWLPERVDELYRLPTIFAYAKKAGFTTWLVDAQVRQGQHQNALIPDDFNYIDHVVTLDRKTPRHLRDEALVPEVQDILEQPGKAFVVVVKWGAHFPWKSNYPESEEFFTPALSSSWGGMTEENREAVFNTYYNAVRWSVDAFLASLLEGQSLENQLVFYTADHGQSILEGSPITHCTKDDPPVSQANVPLLLLGPVAEGLFPDAVAVDDYSQFQLFPSTLAALGYDRNVVDKYGRPFWDGPARADRPRYFYSGNLDKSRRNAFDVSRISSAPR